MSKIDMIAPPVFEPFIMKKARYKVAYGGRGCYPADTEFLTPNGWKRIDEYVKGEKVQCFSPRRQSWVYCDKEVEFVDLEVDQFYRITNERNGVDFTTSEHHKHLLYDSKSNGKLTTKATSEIFSLADWNGSSFKINENHLQLVVHDEGKEKNIGLNLYGSTIEKVNAGSRMYCFTTPTGYFPVRQNGRVYVSGNSGKSWSVARILIEIARRTKTNILCTRELQSSIQDSVIGLLSDTIDRCGYTSEFNVLKTEIVHKGTGAKFLFYGIRHNITKIKSINNVGICWCEEAEAISDESWRDLIPSIRGGEDDSEIWITFNPKNILDSTYQRFIVNPPESSVVIKVNHTENPFFPKTLRDEMEEMKKRDYEMYLHVWEGEPVGDSEFAFIKPLHVRAAVDAHKVLRFGASGLFRVGYDVNDEGDDCSAFVSAHGSVLQSAGMFGKKPQEHITKAVFNYAYMNDADIIIYDSIGVGAGAKIVLKQLNQDASRPIKAIGFNAGGKVRFPKGTYMKGTGKKNEDMFTNLKSQEWWNVRMRFENTYLAVHEGMSFPPDQMISIPSNLPHLDQLMAELPRPQIEYDRNGKIKVESKIDMRKRSVPSPNLADALIMAFSGSAKGGAGLIC